MGVSAVDLVSLVAVAAGGVVAIAATAFQRSFGDVTMIGTIL